MTGAWCIAAVTLLGAFLGIKPPAAAAPAAAHMVASDRQGTSSGADMETKAIITVQIELHDSIGSAVISLLKTVLVSTAADRNCQDVDLDFRS